MRKNSLVKCLLVSGWVLFFCGILPVSAVTLAEQVPTIKTLDYKLDLVVDYEKEMLSGDCMITVSNSGESPLSEVPFLLYRLMDVESVTGENGEPVKFSQTVTRFIDEGIMQVNYITVSLKQPLLKGERKTFKMKYGGYLAGYTETMGYVRDRIDKDYTVIRSDCIAYPRVGYLSWKVNRTMGFQKFNYLINVTIPDSLVAANGGELVGKSVKDGFVTYTYRNIKPAWRIDIAIADYRIVTGKSGDLKIFCFPRHQQAARDMLDVMSKTMKLYYEWFGPLKGFKDFSVIEIPDGYGSQADVTTILQEEDAFRSKKEYYQFYHELSHLWNPTPLDPLPCRFESEGLATFMQYLLEERLDNKKDGLVKGFADVKGRYRERCRENPEYLDIPMIDHGVKGITGLSYGKGMLFFTILYKLVGEKEFFDIIKGYYGKYEGRGATTANFVDHLNRYPKKDLSRFTKDWVYGTQSTRDLMNDLSLKQIVNKYKRS